MSSKEIITAETCRSCGLCCVSPQDQDVYCDVDSEDIERLGRRWSRLHVELTGCFDWLAHALSGDRLPFGAIRTETREVRTGPLRGYRVCACVALKGSVMHRVGCTVYERRPQVCREAVHPGDRFCRQIRYRILEQASG